MASYHNNQLNVVGLFDSGDPSSDMLASATSGYSGIINAANAYLHGHEYAPQVTYGFGCHPVEPERFIASTSGNQDQERKDKAKSKTEVKKNFVEAKSKAKSPVLKRAVQKVNSLVVKLKLGRRGITRKQPKVYVLPKKQPEVHALPMKDMQSETSMLSMNSINDMQAGAHMLQTNNMQAGCFMLPGNNIPAGGLTLPGNSMQAGGFTLPGNNLFPCTSTPAYGAHAHQFSYLGQLQGTQLPQSPSQEEKHYNRNHVVCNSFLHDEFNAIKATVGQDLSPEAKQFHRNHTIADGFMFDEYNRVRATNEELLPLEHIITPESDPFHGGYTSEDLSDPHSQAQGLLDLPEDDFIDFSSFIDYTAHLASR